MLVDHPGKILLGGEESQNMACVFKMPFLLTAFVLLVSSGFLRTCGRGLVARDHYTNGLRLKCLTVFSNLWSRFGIFKHHSHNNRTHTATAGEAENLGRLHHVLQSNSVKIFSGRQKMSSVFQH